MNIQESDILRTIAGGTFTSQRQLAADSGYSLGVVNRSVRSLRAAGYLDKNARLTEKARLELEAHRPRNAVILAAGFGMRMVPINTSSPKALLEVRGERLIDRLIRQLHAVGVTDITVVVGFMKESLEYLIDEFGAELIVNPDYARKNNLHSLALASERIGGTYIVPCDLWCENNPFSPYEPYSWYMVADTADEESSVRVNRKMELIRRSDGGGNRMIGIAYLAEPEAEAVRPALRALDDEKHVEDLWERALYQKDRLLPRARVVGGASVVEINTYEQLRELDAGSNHLKSDAMAVIGAALGVRQEQITDISVLKKGMTNRSFLFSAGGEKYIMRVPGEGTDKLIDRKNEAAVYGVIRGRGLCEDPVYLNAENGCKITRYLDRTRVCDPNDSEDVRRCMEKLRGFHAMGLTVPHTFDIFEQIEFYESLWAGSPSAYRDYRRTKENVFSLRDFVEGAEKDRCLTHIDAVPDNFLFCAGPDGTEELQLIDGEYSGMQDPHVDIAMFAIYSLYDRRRLDGLIDMYFENACPAMIRAKIYCYVSMCGLLWSNWCEYKRNLGVEYGEYSLRQYRYAKDYFALARELMRGGEAMA